MVQVTLAVKSYSTIRPDQINWQDQFTRRYLGGEWRSPIFRDLVVDSIRKHGSRVLDIGCGHGFDDDHALQKSIGDHSSHFVGVEPDVDIRVPKYFDEVHHSILENASVKPESIDVAYSMFVLEHVSDAAAFWNSLDTVLAPRGVFWGFTVDGRHPFRLASNVLEKLRVKDLYLSLLRGKRGQDRYENYPTHYVANTPDTIRRYTDRFAKSDFLSVHRPGQWDYYIPKMAQPLSRLMERAANVLGCSGSVLIVRLQKQGNR